MIPKVEKLKAGMLYDMASLTKVVGTTTVILKLVEDNKISIDDKRSILRSILDKIYLTKLDKSKGCKSKLSLKIVFVFK